MINKCTKKLATSYGNHKTPSSLDPTMAAFEYPHKLSFIKKKKKKNFLRLKSQLKIQLVKGLYRNFKVN